MDTRPIRIFIAEDSPLILEILLSMIASVAGTEVLGSSSHAMESISQIRQMDPNIAILDIRLETGSGLDVLRAIRSEGRTRPVAVVFSNHVPENFRRECRALGADYVFDKANEFRQLEHLLRSLASPAGRCQAIIFRVIIGPPVPKEVHVVTEVEGQLSTLKHGDRVCLIYDAPGDERTVAVFFVKLRLACGDRCIYIAAEWSALDIRRPLIASGVEP